MKTEKEKKKARGELPTKGIKFTKGRTLFSVVKTREGKKREGKKKTGKKEKEEC